MALTQERLIIADRIESAHSLYTTQGFTGPVFKNGYAVHSNGSSDSAFVRMLGTAAPVSNSWKRGDSVYNSAPASGGTIGWVCVTSGAPGTWKTFGAISA